jgi:hypothetical protein
MRKIKRVRKIDGIGDDPVLSLRVVTFGEFDIRRADTSLIKKSKRSQRYIELLEYFLTNRGKKLSAEHIINNLWGDRRARTRRMFCARRSSAFASCFGRQSCTAMRPYRVKPLKSFWKTVFNA